MRIKAIQRRELKYLLPWDQYQEVASRMADYLIPDEHSTGSYIVTSLYFDSVDHKAYWDKIDGQRFRRKLRVRTYDRETASADAPCFVEIKQRLNKTISKRRIILPYKNAIAINAYENLLQDTSVTDRPVLEEIIYLRDVFQLQPACVVSYQRLAYNGGPYEPDLRVTFDTQLKGRVHALSLTQAAENHYFLPPDWCIMEVKINERVPYWLTEMIATYSINLQRISKYCATLEANHAILNQQRIVT